MAIISEKCFISIKTLSVHKSGFSTSSKIRTRLVLFRGLRARGKVINFIVVNAFGIRRPYPAGLWKTLLFSFLNESFNALPLRRSQ